MGFEREAALAGASDTTVSVVNLIYRYVDTLLPSGIRPGTHHRVCRCADTTPNSMYNVGDVVKSIRISARSVRFVEEGESTMFDALVCSDWRAICKPRVF